MKLLRSQSNDPHFNLALDEYLLKETSDDFFVIGINSSSVITGKHQVPHCETDTEYITRNNIPVVRRISGGGTVWHDEGNINFSVIVTGSEGRQIDFRKYTLPVLEFLEKSGIDARLEGKSDLKVNGLKISGNAEHVWKNRVLHHGTLLFNSDLQKLRSALRSDTSCYITRAVASNPSHVVNLIDLVPHIKSAEEFARYMEVYFTQQHRYEKISLTQEQEAKIEKRAGSKYRTWEWNYGYGPEYTFKRGGIELNVSNGLIVNLLTTNEFKLSGIREQLTGLRHMPVDIENMLKKNGHSDATKLTFLFF
jgi:lipoate---protein ligase